MSISGKIMSMISPSGEVIFPRTKINAVSNENGIGLDVIIEELGSTTVTQFSDGLMTAADKKKLDGIAEGANKYTHPGSGTNPHGTTKSDIGLGNVTNDQQMPIYGGTFTGNVAAYGSNRIGANIRNIEPCNSSWNQVYTNHIITIRK